MFTLEEKYNILYDASIHGVILFCFWTAFFLYFVSKMMSTYINSMMTSAINNNMTNILNNLEQNSGINIDSLKQYIPFNNLIKSFNTPDPTSQNNNAWITRLSVQMSLFFLFGLIIMVIFVKYICGINIDIKLLIIQNAIIFAFVGLIEYFFFTRVAMKYNPALPSTLTSTVLQSLSKNLTSGV